MRVTSKGQITIPARIRKEAGLLPNTEGEFIPVGSGEVRLVKTTKKTFRTLSCRAGCHQLVGGGFVAPD